MAADTYHHGHLREALLDAVGGIIDERGVGAVSLREAARRAGVSHSAPAHHFGDKAGLMSAFAARGFDRFGKGMRAAADAVDTPEDRLRAIGLSYLRFSVEERASFEVMFRAEFHDRDDEELQEASRNAFGVLMEAVDAMDPAGLGGADPIHVAMRAWAMVHGLATLWHDGLIGLFTEEDLPSLTMAIFEVDEQPDRTG